MISNALYTINKSALEHMHAKTRTFTSLVQEASHLPADIFVSYFQIRNDGRYLALTQRPEVFSPIYLEWKNDDETFLEDQQNVLHGKGAFSKNLPIDLNSKGMNLYRKNHVQEAVSTLYHGDDGTVESVSLYTSGDKGSLINMALNNQSALRAFKDHIRSQVQDLTNFEDEKVYGRFTQFDRNCASKPKRLCQLHKLERSLRRSETTIEFDGESISLTYHQFRVLDQYAKGYTTKKIAQDLDLSPHTVADYVTTLRKKLNHIKRHEIASLLV